MNFLGYFKYNIDEKNRLSLPASFVPKLNNIVYISYNAKGILELRNVEDYQLYVKEFDTLKLDKNVINDMKRVLFANTFETKVDLNKKRILLPESLKKLINVTKEVAILGNGERIELWNPAKYDQYQAKVLEKLSKVTDSMNEIDPGVKKN